ncbi:hypothetical protein L9F63_020633 [Diploptera punctata]|uniref:Farnesol dehydrogenase n=1 Tax=Diploptera punctata TaxID=6984 RepID=A0AAD7ZSH0_DIPPU|nr:hypothetical protein L9F63_020633 [Diploptera punctata]
MERWAGRVAVVTGASVGIGAAICKELVKKGLKVIGLARRVEKIEELAKSLKSEKGQLYACKCDVTKEEDIKKAFEWVKLNLGGADILINNAGFAKVESLIEGSAEGWRNMLDLNIYGLSLCTKEALQSMKEKGVDDGHIININSVAGHISPPVGAMAMYSATKHAVTVLTEGLRKELVTRKSKIRVTSLSPGLVKTEMPSEEFLATNPYLEAENIAEACLYILGTPPNVQVHELTIIPVGQLL